MAETESDGNIVRYIRGLGLISSDSESAKTYYHYVTDEYSSVTYVVEGEEKAPDRATAEITALARDKKQSRILNHYIYDAFGNTISCEEAVHNRFRYNGEQYDPVTQQYYLRARYYNPVISRFTQEDTYYGDGLNLYRYCANNPVRYKDPSGHGSVEQNPYNRHQNEGTNPADSGNRSKPLSEMTDAELAELGYKRHSDGSIRDAKGHFVGNSGINPGTPGVDIVETHLANNNYEILGREISVRGGENGNTLRRYDIVVKTPDGRVIGVEVKSGTARRTAQQRAIDEQLSNSGGLDAVGQNAKRAGVTRITDVIVIHVDNAGNIRYE